MSFFIVNIHAVILLCLVTQIYILIKIGLRNFQYYDVYKLLFPFYLILYIKTNNNQTFPSWYRDQKGRVVSGPLSNLILIFDFNSNVEIVDTQSA